MPGKLVILWAKGDLCAVLSSTGQTDPSAWPSLSRCHRFHLAALQFLAQQAHSPPRPPVPLAYFLWLPVCLLREAPCFQIPAASTSSSSSQPGLPHFPPSSAGYHWFSTSWEWPELFCLLARAETRKGGKITQLSSWIELLKAASSLPQRGHTAKEGEKFGVVSTAGRVGGNGCGWPGRLSQPS